MEQPKGDFRPLYHGGSLIIGQEQDGNLFSGKFNAEEAFSGYITQVEVWNIELTAKEIYDIGNCVQLTVRSENQVVTWGSDSWESIKMDPLEDFPLESFCKEYPLRGWMIWPDQVDFISLNYFCEIVGGKFTFSIKC